MTPNHYMKEWVEITISIHQQKKFSRVPSIFSHENFIEHDILGIHFFVVTLRVKQFRLSFFWFNGAEQNPLTGRAARSIPSSVLLSTNFQLHSTRSFTSTVEIWEVKRGEKCADVTKVLKSDSKLFLGERQHEAPGPFFFWIFFVENGPWSFFF